MRNDYYMLGRTFAPPPGTSGNGLMGCINTLSM
jgi:hypothetical protein